MILITAVTLHLFQMMLVEYKRVKSKIQMPIDQLMAPHLANVDDVIHPGLTSLNWTSLNIERYLNNIFDKLGKPGILPSLRIFFF